MNGAYLDTSCLVAIAFGEPGGEELAGRLRGFDELFASNLLEAELWASFAREEVPRQPAILRALTWILPDRPLSGEIATALSPGYLRGADLWHLACALYLVDSPPDIFFLTLDERQTARARELGFRV